MAKNISSLDALAESLVRLTATAVEPRAARAARLRAAKARREAAKRAAAEAERLAPIRVRKGFAPRDEAGLVWRAKRDAVMRGEAPSGADVALMAMRPEVYYTAAELAAATGFSVKTAARILRRDLEGLGLARRHVWRDPSKAANQPKRRRSARWLAARGRPPPKAKRGRKSVGFKMTASGLARRVEMLSRWKGQT